MSFSAGIAPAVNRELSLAAISPDPQAAFKHLERAHVLGQHATVHHVRSHWRMLCWAVAQSSMREMLGQIFRIVGAATKTVFGFVPAGNTGGSNVNPFRPMPVPEDLQAEIDAALIR